MFDIWAKEIGYPYADTFLDEDRAPKPLVPHLAPRKVLLVDPNPDGMGDAEAILRLLARVDVCVDFSRARDQLMSSPPDLLVANIRLRKYNALHLVLRATPATKCIVYATHHDPVLARDAQTAGAFYEHSMRLAPALVGYLSATLPARDRRNADRPDRRNLPRGGRRSSDL
jgi:DNA-binding NtrC family response regulator